VIDFEGNVHHQAFLKVLDFCYLDDINVLAQVKYQVELIEIIKLSSQYKLNRLLQAAQRMFKDKMVIWLDSSQAFLTLKKGGSSGNAKS